MNITAEKPIIIPTPVYITFPVPTIMQIKSAKADMRMHAPLDNKIVSTFRSLTMIATFVGEVKLMCGYQRKYDNAHDKS